MLAMKLTELIHFLPTILATFLASLVEFTEALTIVLAVGTTRGWRPALFGTGLGILLLVGLVLTCGPQLKLVPLHHLQMVIGVLLLLFGLRWLRKAILRTAGLIALHDEDKAFAQETSLLKAAPKDEHSPFEDPIAVLTAFKAVVLEGVEVVFIVIATGGTARSLWPATFGAIASLIVVIALGLILHKPLSKIPENQLKFAVGAMLTAFGCFWVGESLGYPWPGEDWSLLLLLAAFTAISILCAKFAKRVSVGIKKEVRT